MNPEDQELTFARLRARFASPGDERWEEQQKQLKRHQEDLMKHLVDQYHVSMQQEDREQKRLDGSSYQTVMDDIIQREREGMRQRRALHNERMRKQPLHVLAEERLHHYDDV